MKFQRTTCFNKIASLRKRKRVVQGGTSAGKTVNIIARAIDKSIKVPQNETSIVSETMPHLRKGAMKDFIKIMKSTGRWRRKEWHATDRIYTFPNGSTIEFFSVDNEDKVKGPRRDDLYINEANNISFETYHQLMIRTRWEVWLDFNPTMSFWVHTEVLPDDDAELLIVNYTDNEALDDVTIGEIERAREKGFHNPSLPNDKLFDEGNVKNEYWSNWYRVYGLGLVGSLQGAIITDWKQIDTIPHDDEGNVLPQLVAYGLDFGFSNDPNALIAVYKMDGELYIDEIGQRKGLLNRDIAAWLKKETKRGVEIIADSAEPKTIADLQSYGFNMDGVDKSGGDYVNYSIGVVQSYTLNITKRSTELIKEIRGYVWAKNKRTGEQLPKPVDGLPDHSIDALRYVATMKLGATGTVDEDTWGIH